MKINPLHSLTTNPYQNQPAADQKQVAKDTAQKQTDKLEISTDAKKMLEHSDILADREKKIAELKKQFEAGTYQIDFVKTAEKMLDFWKK